MKIPWTPFASVWEAFVFDQLFEQDVVEKHWTISEGDQQRVNEESLRGLKPHTDILTLNGGHVRCKFMSTSFLCM